MPRGCLIARQSRPVPPLWDSFGVRHHDFSRPNDLGDGILHAPTPSHVLHPRSGNDTTTLRWIRAKAEFGSWYFRGMNFTNAILEDTVLANADLTGADLAGSRFWEAKLYQNDDAQANSSPAMSGTKPITSVAELIQQCQEISDQDEELTLFFRGERDHRWKLYPSVMRPSRDGEFKLRPSEGEMLRELISRRPEDFKGMTSALEQLVIAQHYGLKTRLLDVTRNPCVALFSACDARDPAGVAHKNDMDGMLHVFAVPKSLIKSFDSDTISIIANFAKLERNYQGLLLGKATQTIFEEGTGTAFKPLYSEGMRRLYHFFDKRNHNLKRLSIRRISFACLSLNQCSHSSASERKKALSSYPRSTSDSSVVWCRLKVKVCLSTTTTPSPCHRTARMLFSTS